MEPRRIYISGKIGEQQISEATKRKFARAEEMLKVMGHTVINPTDDYFQFSMKTDFEIFKSILCYEGILFYDLGWLRTCTAIYLLEDWKDSPGARTEYEYAKATGKYMFFQDRGQAANYLDELLTKNWKECKPLMLPDEGESDFDCKVRFEKEHISEVWLPIEDL